MRGLVPLRWSTIHPAIQSGTLTNGTSRNRPVCLEDDQAYERFLYYPNDLAALRTVVQKYEVQGRKPDVSMVLEPIDKGPKTAGS